MEGSEGSGVTSLLFGGLRGGSYLRLSVPGFHPLSNARSLSVVGLE